MNSFNALATFDSWMNETGGLTLKGRWSPEKYDGYHFYEVSYLGKWRAMRVFCRAPRQLKKIEADTVAKTFAMNSGGIKIFLMGRCGNA